MDPRDVVTLGHGSGGRLTHALIRDLFVRRFNNPALAAMGDSALIGAVDGQLAFTTDAFVVSPLFFRGGDIGKLAVCGTVNDLAVAGAVPLYLSASFILEEGLALGDLDRVAASMAEAAVNAGVAIVTGDTKVVERGHGDGVFITTAGVGRLRQGAPEGAGSVRVGDAVVVSGPIGDHGAVIAAHRSGLVVDRFSSDCGAVTDVVGAMYDVGVRPRFMRDPTRGGLATVLAELAGEANVSVSLREVDLPVQSGVRGVCDILGLDPMYLACEGRVLAVVAADQAEAAASAMRRTPAGRGACVIGEITAPASGPVVLRTRFGGTRLYDTLASEQLPRIC
jgi:hydrogenase expression/formation protein HypE